MDLFSKTQLRRADCHGTFEKIGVGGALKEGPMTDANVPANRLVQP